MESGNLHYLLAHPVLTSIVDDRHPSPSSGDNWTVECSGTEWRRDEAVRLRHSDTNM